MIFNKGFEVPDTSLINFSQNCDFLYQGNRWFQNLGVFGTAGHSLYFELPQNLGLRYGSNAFDYLLPDASQIKYYNTLSPYSSFQYVEGGRKRQMLRVTFSQNVTSQWNVAVHYQRLTALRTINVTQSEQRLNDHYSMYVSTNFISKNKKFSAWGYYQHANQLAYESGGVLPDSGDTQDSLFSPEIENAQLDVNARNRELRHNWGLNMKWKPFENGIFIRSAHSRIKQINRYTDYLPRAEFYGGNTYFQRRPPGETTSQLDTLFNERIYRLWENAVFVGMEDSITQFSLFIKNRSTIFYSNLYTSFLPKSEMIYGAMFSANLFKGNVSGIAEFLNSKEWNIRGRWTGYGLEATARWFAYSPSIMQQELVSKNLIYQTSFRNSKAFQLTLSQSINLGKWKVIPGYEQYIVSDGIAFDRSYTPFQTGGTSLMQYLKIGLNGQLGNVFFTQNQFIKVLQSGSRISQMPGMVYHSAHWVELFRRKKGYAVQFGFNLDWRADVQSENYQPLTGQWYVQDIFQIRPYFLCDVFTHIRIQRARVYLKVHNLNQGWGSEGYFATPFYPGQARRLELGVVWTFYD